MGEGFSSLIQESTGEYCLEEAGAIDEIRLDWLNDKTYWAEVLHSETDIERKISGRLEGDMELGVISADVDGHYDGAVDESTTQDVLTLGITLRTVEQYIVPNQNYQSNEVCNQEGDYLGFTEVCGDQYVEREVLGGVCLMSADITNLSEEDKELIKGKLQVGAIGLGELDVEGSWNEINGQISQELRFWVDCIGLDDPTSHVLVNGELTRGGFGNFLHELQCGESTLDKDGELVLSACDGSDSWGYEEAYNAYVKDSSARFHSSLGAVVDRGYQDYKFNGFIDYCVGDVLDDAETCYADFMKTAYHQREHVEDIVERTNEKIDNQSDYYWGEDEADAISRWQLFKTVADDCQNQWAERLEMCHEQLSNNGPESEVCWACSAPDECDPEYLEDLEGRLPDVETHMSRQSPTEREELLQNVGPLDLGDISDTLCTLSSVRGRFAGGGEKAIVESINGEWSFTVNSQRTEENEEVAASAICVDTQNFYDGKSNTFWIDATMGTSATSSFGGAAHSIPLDSYPHVAAISGIQGDFDGSGDSVSAVEPSISGADWTLNVTSTSVMGNNTIWGWATMFGLDNPAGGQPGWIEDPEYIASNAPPSRDDKIYSTRMAPSDEAYCFLTDISANFVGGGEKVRIYENEGAWMLEIWAGCADYSWGGFGDDCQERKHVEAKARCIPFDQSP